MNLFSKKIIAHLIKKKAVYNDALIDADAQSDICDNYEIHFRGVNHASQPPIKWTLLCDQIDKDGLTGRYWVDGELSKDEEHMLFSRFKTSEVKISHYIRGKHEPVIYRSFVDYFFNGFLPWVKCKLYFWKLRQTLYNRTGLERKHRILVLKSIQQDALSNGVRYVDAFYLCRKLHSSRLIAHPKSNEQFEYYRYLLDSLVESGDLSRSNRKYALTDKAMKTISDSQDAIDKHEDTYNQNAILIFLTAGLLLFAAATYFF